MADTIIVHCYKCGNNLGEVTYIPGEQLIGCSNCGGQTKVRIKKDGSVDIF